MIHKKLAAGGWQKMSLAEQLANVGSEYNRFVHHSKSGDLKSKEFAFRRLMELLNLTISDKRWKNRLPELCKLREVITSEYSGSGEYNVSSENLKNCFLDFAILARS